MTVDTITVRSNEKPATPPPAAPAAEAGKVVEENVEDGSVPTAEAEAAEDDSDSETEQAEAEGEEEQEGEEPAAASPKEGEEEGKAKPKKKSGFQRRLAKKDREIEFWKAEALKARGAQAPKAEQPAPPADSAPIVVEAAGKPKAADFTSNEEFVEAMGKWTADQRAKADKAEALRKSQADEVQSIEQAHATRINEFAKKNPDFHETIDAAGLMISQAMTTFVVMSDTGPAILYHLAQNPDESNRIAMLPPLRAAAELGKIEARLAPKAAAPKVTKKVTNAPEPLTPVGGGARGASVVRDIYQADKMSQEEYERARAEQIKQRSQAK